MNKRDDRRSQTKSVVPFSIAFNLLRYRSSGFLLIALVSPRNRLTLHYHRAKLFAFIIQIKVNEIDAKTRFLD